MRTSCMGSMALVALRSKLGRSFLIAMFAVMVLGGVPHAFAQPLDSSFTYQGRLNVSGAPVSGTYDVRFRLYNAAAGGAQVGATLCSDNVAIADGAFTVRLDFGAQFAGQQRFLEIDVRQDTGLACANATGFTTLVPRQALTASPNAAYALTAGTATTATTATSATTATNATQLNGQTASFYQNAGNLTAGSIPDGRLAGTYSGALTFNNAANSITGSGAGLSNVNAAQLGGQGLSAFGRLATGQTWTAANTFNNASNAFTGTFTGGGAGLTGVNADLLDGINSTALGQLGAGQTWTAANTFSNASNSFTGNGGGLTNVNAAQLGGQALAAFGRLATNQQWTGVNNFSGVSNTFTGSQFNGGFFNGNGSGLTNVNAATIDGLDSTAFLQAVPVPLIITGSNTLGVLQAVTSTSQNSVTAMFAQITGSTVGSSALWAQATGTNFAVYAEGVGSATAVLGITETGIALNGAAITPTGVGVLATGSGTALRSDGYAEFRGAVQLTPGNSLSIGAGASPAFPLHFASMPGNKIGLFGSDPNAHYGLGVQTGTLQLYTDAPTGAIALGSGGSEFFDERVRFSGGADMIFRNNGIDAFSSIQSPYDFQIEHDRDNDNTDSWVRVFTNGTAIEQMRIEDSDEGPAKFDGAVNANGIDYAEAFKAADPTLEPGDLVVSSGNWESIVRSEKPYDAAVIGVISTRPAFVAGMSFDVEDRIDPALTVRRDAARAAGDTALEKQLTMQMSALVKQAYRPVAFMGRVPTKVIGAVNVGDHLCASSVAGRAMAMSTAGHSVGIALEASDGGEQTIMVLIQPKYHVPVAEADGEIPSDLQQFQRILAENDDLRARLERLEALLTER